MRLRRQLALLPAIALLAALLTACQSGEVDLNSSGNQNDGNSSGAYNLTDEGCVASGDISDSIEIDGEFGGEVSLASKTPIEAEGLQRTVLISGKGKKVDVGDEVSTSISMINGSTGELLGKFKDVLQLEGEYLPYISSALQCAVVGDRVVTVMPASDLYGEGQVASMGIPNLNEEDSMVIVFDFIETVEVLEKAAGKEIPLPEDAPKVEISETGEPTITIPKGLKAPEKLTVYTMVEGDGRVVKDTDQVKVHYRGIIWRTGEEFDSSWSRGQSANFAVNGVIGGFKEALVGHKVGSRMISVVPAEDGGYGSSWLEGEGYESDDVMVFVLDILGAS